MSRTTLVLVALVALLGTSAAVEVSMSFSNGRETSSGRFGTAGIGASGSLESSMSFDMSGAMVDMFGHQDIVDSKVETHSVMSVVRGHRHSVGTYWDTHVPAQTVTVDGDIVHVTFHPL